MFSNIMFHFISDHRKNNHYKILRSHDIFIPTLLRHFAARILCNKIEIRTLLKQNFSMRACTNHTRCANIDYDNVWIFFLIPVTTCMPYGTDAYNDDVHVLSGSMKNWIKNKSCWFTWIWIKMILEIQFILKILILRQTVDSQLCINIFSPQNYHHGYLPNQFDTQEYYGHRTLHMYIEISIQIAL